MELFDNLLLGFSVALQWNNLLYCLIGALIGTFVSIIDRVPS